MIAIEGQFFIIDIRKSRVRLLKKKRQHQKTCWHGSGGHTDDTVKGRINIGSMKSAHCQFH